MLEFTRQAMAGPSTLAAAQEMPIVKPALAEQTPEVRFSQRIDALEQTQVLEPLPVLDPWLLEPVQALPGEALSEPVGEVLEPLLAETLLPVPDNLAEQWLQGMLGQREVQLSAREARAEQGELLPGGRHRELPVQVQLTQSNLPDLPELSHQSLANLRPVQAQALPVVDLEPVLVSVEAAPAKAPQATPAVVLPVQVLAGVETLPSAEGARLVSAVTEAPSLPALSASTVAHPAQRLAAEAPEVRLGEQILQTLRNSIEVQVRQNIQQATVRLDPPELGSLEIFLSHESGRLQINITAANADVSRLLQQTSERLRQDLVAANFLQVNVQVGSEGHSGRQQQRSAQQPADDLIRHAALLDEDTREHVARDVLVTV